MFEYSEVTKAFKVAVLPLSVMTAGPQYKDRNLLSNRQQLLIDFITSAQLALDHNFIVCHYPIQFLKH